MKVQWEKSSLRQVPDWEVGSLCAESLRELALALDRQEGGAAADFAEGRTGLTLGIGLAVWLVVTLLLCSFLSVWEGIHARGGTNGLGYAVDINRSQDRPEEDPRR